MLKLKRITGTVCGTTGGNCLWTKIKPFVLFLHIIGLAPFSVLRTSSEKIEVIEQYKFKYDYWCFGSLANGVNFTIIIILIQWISHCFDKYTGFWFGSEAIIILPYAQNIGLIAASRILYRHLLNVLNSLRTYSLQINCLQKQICPISVEPFSKLKKWCYLFIIGIIVTSGFHGMLIYFVTRESCSEFIKLDTKFECLSKSGFNFIVVIFSQFLLPYYPLGVLIFYLIICYIIHKLLIQITEILKNISNVQSPRSGIKHKAEEIEAIRLIHENLCRCARRLGFYFIIQIVFIWIVAGSNIITYMFESGFLINEPSTSNKLLHACQGIFGALAFLLVLSAEHIINNSAKLPRVILLRIKTFHLDTKSEFQILLFLQQFNNFQAIKVSPLSPVHVAVIPFGCEKLCC